MIRQYWEYFLSIEADLEKCARYVDFSEQNYTTNSVEFARIIMTSAAEIDTVAKELCKLISSNSNANNICGYAQNIISQHPEIVNIEISIANYGLSVKPWLDWSENNSPAWWKEYNDIKHNRTTHFEKANLLNAISAVAGLLSMLLYYYFEKNGSQQEQISSFDSPKFFDVVDNRPNNGGFCGGIFWGYYLA